MDNLEKLKTVAGNMRSAANFLRGAIVKFDGTTGEWKTKSHADELNGRQLVALVPDLVHGWQKFVNNKPVTHLGLVLSDWKFPARDQLDERDERRWSSGKDPWHEVFYLPLFDADDGEPLVYTTNSQGGKDAIANLLDGYVSGLKAHPEDADKLPLVELATDSYVHKTHGKRIHIPILEMLAWTERPQAAPVIKPPADDPQLIEHAAAPTDDADSRQNTGANDMDDEIPF